MSEKINEEYIWKILQAYNKENNLVFNQIESYNDFVNFGLQEIIEQESLICLPNYTAKFEHICLSVPQVIEEDRNIEMSWPMDARRRELNYDSAILCDITELYHEEKETKKHIRIVIGRMPVMLRSSICNLSKLSDDERINFGECPNDLGGYFVIKGNERVLVGQMRNIYNQVFVLKQKNGNKYKIIAETRSMSDETGHSVLLQAKIGIDDRSIFFSLPYIKEPIPIGVVFKSLGYNDDDIVNFIGLDSEKSNKYIRYILRDSFFCSSKKEALLYISKFGMHVIADEKKEDYAKQIVENEMLPHLGISSNLTEKACFLGRMVKKLIMTNIGEREEDDRDNYANKRIETAGTLLYDIFRNLFKKYIQFIKAQLEKRKQKPDIISVISRLKSITKGLHQCLATGNWGVQKNASYVRTGVSQLLDRMTYCATLSHLRRILIPMGKEGKNVAIRQIHSSSFGFVCPCECFHPDTKILLWNGRTKLAKNIKVGDILIDDTGNQTSVRSKCSGVKEMYMIKHKNKNFENYIVTDNHILSLVCSKHKEIEKNGDKYKVNILNSEKRCIENIIFESIEEAEKFISLKEEAVLDISISEYENLEQNFKQTLKTFKSSGINWTEKNKMKGHSSFLFGRFLKQKKTIPEKFIITSKENRLLFLEGMSFSKDCFLDKNALTIYTEKYSSRIIKKLIFMLNSLGFFVYQDTNKLVCSKGKEYLQSDFTLQKMKKQPYVGWQLNGNGRFLLSDFTVTHNTPEGKKIGVVLNYALSAKVTKKISKVVVKSVLEKCKTIISLEKIVPKNIKDATIIFLNGSIVGFSEDVEETIKEVKAKRENGLLEREISISYDILDNDIKIFCDEGRFIRPFFTLSNNKLNIQPQEKYKWKSLIKKGLIQYLDPSEIENSVIAMTPLHLTMQHNDFCEIHPSLMLGIMAAMIPFSDHSQSPRNCYQSSMGKQALGIPILSYNLRSDTLLHVLHYPQKPIVYTKAAEIFGINNMPSGINAIVAIACYSGFNQEDSVMLNLSSIQRGLFCLTSYHTIDCIEKKRDTYSYEEICLPPENSDKKENFFKRKTGNYSLLDENGIIKPREKFENGKWIGRATEVKKGDVIIGKVIVNGGKSTAETKIDDSVVIQPGEEGIIDRVYTVVTPNGYKLVKIVIRVTREPTLGDKLASRAAQKGTIGMVYRQEDMPFTRQGITPDIIINPLCMPSRMTINQLIECALGKECVLNGNYGDATPFTENSVNVADKLVSRLESKIQDYGFQSQGWEIMCNGMTGEQIKTKIFIGPTYYQRLKHMVDDKMHARAQGHVTMLTRQPLEGRSRDGGLRFGEMERDCMIAHGNTAILKERLFSVSDPFKVTVCKNCGIMTTGLKECQMCKGDEVLSCNFPYASKLLHQELTSLCLKVVIRPDKN